MRNAPRLGLEEQGGDGAAARRGRRSPTGTAPPARPTPSRCGAPRRTARGTAKRAGEPSSCSTSQIDRDRRKPGEHARGRPRPRCGRAARARRPRARATGTRGRAARSRPARASGVDAPGGSCSARSAAPMPLPGVDVVDRDAERGVAAGVVRRHHRPDLRARRARAPWHGMHTSPRAQRSMKLIASGVTHSAAIVRSPSFSRSSSSTTSTISPRRIRRSASSIGASVMGLRVLLREVAVRLSRAG